MSLLLSSETKRLIGSNWIKLDRQSREPSFQNRFVLRRSPPSDRQHRTSLRPPAHGGPLHQLGVCHQKSGMHGFSGSGKSEELVTRAVHLEGSVCMCSQLIRKILHMRPNSPWFLPILTDCLWISWNKFHEISCKLKIYVYTEMRYIVNFVLYYRYSIV